MQHRCFVVLVIGIVSTASEARHPLNMWYGYAKEELACFRETGEAAELLIGNTDFEKKQFRDADIVSIMELAVVPTKAMLDRIEVPPPEAGKDPIQKPKACSERPGAAPGLGLAHLLAPHTSGKELLQIQLEMDAEPDEPDLTLLSVWYDSSKVTPGPAFAYRNRWKDTTGNCFNETTLQVGNITVPFFEDLLHSQCDGKETNGLSYADSTQYVVAASFVPIHGQPFAILGVDLANKHYKGHNYQLKHAMDDVVSKLKVPKGRVFIGGDLNSRLEDKAWEKCENYECGSTPKSVGEAIDQADQPEELTASREDVDPCQNATTYSSNDACRVALEKKQRCRRDCIANLLCNSSSEWSEDVFEDWEKLDTKRGDFDLLSEYFTFPSEKTLMDGVKGPYRFPTYKRTANEKVDGCDGDITGTSCTLNPCHPDNWQGSHETCTAAVTKCFKKVADTKLDKLDEEDPLFEETMKQPFVSPQIGWLDGVGFSKQIEDDVNMLMYANRDALTFGDHVPFVASWTFQVADDDDSDGSDGSDDGDDDDDGNGGIISFASGHQVWLALAIVFVGICQVIL